MKFVWHLSAILKKIYLCKLFTTIIIDEVLKICGFLLNPNEIKAMKNSFIRSIVVIVIFMSALKR